MEFNGNLAGSSARKLSRLKRALQACRAHQEQSLSVSQAPDIELRDYPLAGVETPATANQTGIWFLCQKQGNEELYSVARQFRLQGDFDEASLALALSDLVARHSALRTTFHFKDPQLVQRIGGEMPVSQFFSVVDLRSMLQSVREEQRLATATAYSERWCRERFDLEQGPLFRVFLCRLTATDHLLVLNVHHALTDGWSHSLIIEQLAVCYNARRMGREPEFDEPAAQFATVVESVLEAASDAQLSDLFSEWQYRLEGIPDCINLPLDKPRPARTSGEGDRVEVDMQTEDIDALRALASRQRSTPFGVFMSAFMLVMFKLTGQHKIAVGVPLANREDSQVKRAVGFVANTLPLVATLSPQMTGHELIDHVTQSLFDLLQLQHTPFGKLVQQINPKRDQSYHPLFQMAFSLQPDRGASVIFDGLSTKVIPRVSASARFDLTLMLDLGKDQTSFFLDYAVDLFHRATVERWVADMFRALQFLDNSDDQPISEFVLGAPAAVSNKVGAQPKAVPELFDGVAQRFAEKTALVMAGDTSRTLSYAQLDQHATEFAQTLISGGICNGDYVGICLPRSFNAVIAILGTLKAGAIYLPLNPLAPVARIKGMLCDSGAKLVVVGHDIAVELTCGSPPRWVLTSDHRLVPSSQEILDQISPLSVRAPLIADENTPACLLYTSGSTGTPKGVLLPHRAIVRLVQHAAYARLDSQLVMLHMAPLEFDAATFELWGPLLNGGTCVVCPDTIPDPVVLQKTIREQQVTTAWFTSSLFNALVDEMPQALSGLKEIFTGGEALSAPHIERALDALPDVVLSNGYGPTENGTFTTVYRIPADYSAAQGLVPIGRPIAGGEVYILDGKQMPVRPGAEGELWVSGQGVALGYLNRPDDKAFCRLPEIASGLLYRTGDKVRQGSDGNLLYIGRYDDQVKINGFRIEPGEVEHALHSLPQISNAAVAVHRKSSRKRLLAFVVPQANESADLIRSALAETLPEHMLPQVISVVSSLPITPNGKVDRQRLLREHSGEDSVIVESEQVCVMSDIEAGIGQDELLAIWREMLERPDLQIDDNFFEAGGHSILAVRLMARVEKKFGKQLALGSLFETPSVSGQWALLNDIHPASSVAAVAPEPLLSEATQPETPAPAMSAVSAVVAEKQWSVLVPVKPSGSLSPLFIVHAIGGQVHGFSHFAKHFPDDLPIYGIQCHGYESGQTPHHDMVQMAANYIAEIRRLQPDGPYFLGGLSFGGLVAFEMAVQLERAGERVAFLLIGDTLFSQGPHIHPLNKMLARIPVPPLRTLSAVWRSHKEKKAKQLLFVSASSEERLDNPKFNALNKLVRDAHSRALSSYEPARIQADVTLVSADTYPRSRAALMRQTGSATWGWEHLTKGRVIHHELQGSHHTMFYGEQANRFADVAANTLSALPDVMIERTSSSDLM